MDDGMSKAGDNSSLSKYMPEKMHEIGFAMHSAADEFAAEAREASSPKNYRRAIESLSRVTR